MNLTKCDGCHKRRSLTELFTEKYCEVCFEKRFGANIPDFSEGSGSKARYDGGHSSFSPSKGFLYLTKDYLIFVARRFEIRIPITSITTNKIDTHRFVIPYIDRNTNQEPSFDIHNIFHSTNDEWIEQINKIIANNSLKQPPIKNELTSQEVYDDLKSGKMTIEEYVRKTGIIKETTPTPIFSNTVMSEIQNNQADSKNKKKQIMPTEKPKNINTTSQPTVKDDEIIRVLKMRLAKGEITKEEFEDTKKLLKD